MSPNNVYEFIQGVAVRWETRTFSVGLLSMQIYVSLHKVIVAVPHYECPPPYSQDFPGFILEVIMSLTLSSQNTVCFHCSSVKQITFFLQLLVICKQWCSLGVRWSCGFHYHSTFLFEQLR